MFVGESTKKSLFLFWEFPKQNPFFKYSFCFEFNEFFGYFFEFLIGFCKGFFPLFSREFCEFWFEFSHIFTHSIDFCQRNKKLIPTSIVKFDIFTLDFSECFDNDLIEPSNPVFSVYHIVSRVE